MQMEIATIDNYSVSGRIPESIYKKFIETQAGIETDKSICLRFQNSLVNEIEKNL